MARVFLIIMDSLGIGGAPDADAYFNNGVPDTGANTLLHIALGCANGLANHGREGPLYLPNLTKLGLGAALKLACQESAPNLNRAPEGTWGCAQETSRGKDTPSGHWELAGLPVDWDWHFFPEIDPTFSEDLVKLFCETSKSPEILGNCHASGTEIINKFGAKHCQSGWPIFYTSEDSVVQIAGHEETFGLKKLLTICETLSPELHKMGVGRVIARPFRGQSLTGFYRTRNRRDYAVLPPKPLLTNWVQNAGHPVTAIGKIGDIFSMQGIDQVLKGTDKSLMKHLSNQVSLAPEGSFIFSNFVEFDSQYGHRRDLAGYACALEWFDKQIGPILSKLRADDLMIFTADHGNDPTWIGTGHTRERVPVLCAGLGRGELGQIKFQDVANLVLNHLDIEQPKSKGHLYEQKEQA